MVLGSTSATCVPLPPIAHPEKNVSGVKSTEFESNSHKISSTNMAIINIIDAKLK